MIRSLLTPDAHRDPYVWAAVLLAHFAIGAMLWPLVGWWVAPIYAVFEIAQAVRVRLMAWDSVLDWRSIRKVKDGETTDDLFGFLTTSPNAEVKPVHPKAMPVILTTPGEWQAWLNLTWDQAKALQRPLADGMLKLI